MLVKAGLFDCIQKPVSLRELETVVARCLNPVSAYTALHAVADNAGSVRLEDLH
jgi:DNA-binding NtrC family response regulator